MLKSRPDLEITCLDPSDDMMNICKSKLIDREDHLECSKCNIGYPIEEDIPRMLEERIFTLND